MNDLSEIIKRYTIKYDTKIKSLTDHLDKFLNIFSYTYFKIESDGRFVTLANNPECIDFYYFEKYFLHNPYFVDPKLLKSGIVFTSTTQNKNYLDTVSSILNRFQVDHTFLMLEKTEGRVEGFLFGAKESKSQTSFNYMNYLDVLKKFNSYFTREMSTVLGKMHADRFNIKNAKGKSFFERDRGLPLAANDKISQDFLKMISPLSPQEERCLSLFRQGYSAQATASIMGLSRRTVEHYFETIKRKLGCYSKWDLLKLG